MSNALGEIKLVGFPFEPVNWAFCDGRLMPISGNEALYKLLGTTFGGNGVTTFALPDLRGRVPAHPGGMLGVRLGGQQGTENVTLELSQIPAHTHGLQATGASGSSSTPSGNTWAAVTDNTHPMYATTAPNATMSSQCFDQTGNGQPHENRQPFLALNYIIALTGVTPTP